MVYPGTYEQQMQENAKTDNVKAALKDTAEVLNDMGYKAGADIFKQMMCRFGYKDERGNNGEDN